ncbi:MAG TPA: hypothetical protein VGQ99_10635 [Tepidisphaeraceae bacterium]|jgi:hypothetical protein|nr:hypothetical protein [Tepidisphaeraceae bacterium]
MNLRNEAMLMLEKRGAVMDTAVKVSRLLKKRDIDGVIIGGVAVVLHGYVRTTRDVDVALRGAFKECKAAFEDAGMEFDAKKREFNCDGVPVRLVPEKMVKLPAAGFVEIEGVTTVRLGDLISIKLKSGLSSRVRAQDIADVIGLIRAHSLGELVCSETGSNSAEGI